MSNTSKQNRAWERAQRANPQFVRMHDGHPVMRCSECDKEHWTGSEGITTSDGKELCISCQCDLRDLYDEDWQLLENDGGQPRAELALSKSKPQ